MEINVKTQDIVKKGFELAQITTDIPIYDKYRLIFSLNTGEKKTIFLYADKNSIPTGSIAIAKGLVKQFFLGFIFENETIKYDRVYLGSFNSSNDGKPVNDRDSYVDDGYESKQSQFNRILAELELVEKGEISQQEFEKKFPKIYEQRQSFQSQFKQSLQVTSKSQPVIKPGKHYALGDIHGYKAAYDAAMKQLAENDSIVILGDVIDRGNEGIDIILDLIERGANSPGSNIRFVMGNHELMMLEYIQVVRKYNLQQDEIDAVCEYGKKLDRMWYLLQEIKNPTGCYFQDPEEYKKSFIEMYNNEIKCNEEFLKYYQKYQRMGLYHPIKISIWFHKFNGGKNTIERYNQLSNDDITKVLSFLENSYIIYNQTIQGQNKLFVHSRPPENIELIKGLKGKNDSGIKFSEIPYQDATFAVWEKEVDTYTPCKVEGFTTICGHIKTLNTSIINRQEGYIRLDEGCGSRYTTGLYCIEDGTILHISYTGEIENVNGKLEVIDEHGKVQHVEGNKIPEPSEGR